MLGKLIICASLAFNVVATNSLAANWYDAERRACEFESAIAIEPPFKLAKTQAGGYYFSIPKVNLNLVLNAPGGAVKVSNKLSSSELLILKSKVKQLATGPQAASIALAVASEIVDYSGVYALASGALLGWLGSNAETSLSNVDRLVDFITVGGEVGYDIAFRSAPVGFKPLVLVMTKYQIQVGEEPNKRKWLFSTCLLPVEIILSEVITTATGPNSNNKRFNRAADGIWTQWDITDSKFDSSRYKYIDQDVAYAYFIDVLDATRRMRVHLYGGPIEIERPGSSWKAIYLTTDSK
jgi:hypothetical protein